MVLPTGVLVVEHQRSTYHTGARIVIRESIEDTLVERKEDTGPYGPN